MNRFRTHRTAAAGTGAALAGFAIAALFGVALAAAFTLQVAKNAQVTDQAGATARENIVVTARGFAVYELTGDTTSHPKCTKGNGCFAFWPPVKVAAAGKLSKAPGIRGKLRAWHRDGFLQLTLGGHPLYRFAPDTQTDHATGQGIHGFGGTWHVIALAGSAGGGTPAGTSTMTTTTMMTTTTTTTATTTGTTPCLYPPYC
jgi:predicted lipoprotein with Yx(FWY)xxD motif